MSGGVSGRQSETVDQRLYEQELHRRKDMGDCQEDLNSEFEEMDISQRDTEKHGRLHKFYEKRIKPAFPEAITDIKIFSGMTALEARVRQA